MERQKSTSIVVTAPALETLKDVNALLSGARRSGCLTYYPVERRNVMKFGKLLLVRGRLGTAVVFHGRRGIGRTGCRWRSVAQQPLAAGAVGSSRGDWIGDPRRGMLATAGEASLPAASGSFFASPFFQTAAGGGAREHRRGADGAGSERSSSTTPTSCASRRSESDRQANARQLHCCPATTIKKQAAGGRGDGDRTDALEDVEVEWRRMPLGRTASGCRSGWRAADGRAALRSQRPALAAEEAPNQELS